MKTIRLIIEVIIFFALAHYFHWWDTATVNNQIERVQKIGNHTLLKSSEANETTDLNSFHGKNDD